MSDSLKADYDDLQAAAAAMTTAAARVRQALAGLQGAGDLPASAFGDKGTKVASWYAPNRTNAINAVNASHDSFQQLAAALRRSAAVYALIDAALGQKASG